MVFYLVIDQPDALISRLCPAHRPRNFAGLFVFKLDEESPFRMDPELDHSHKL